MQLDGYRVFGIDARDHDVLAHGRRLTHQFDHQAPADTLTAPIAANVNAVFDAVLIAGRRAKFEVGEPPWPVFEGACTRAWSLLG